MTIRETFPTARKSWTSGPYTRYADNEIAGRICVRSNQIEVPFRTSSFPFGPPADRIHFKYPRFSIFIAREMEA